VIPLAALQAHWMRDWLRAPGIEDTTTRVHWMQCGPFYADLRVPMGLPDVSGAEALADLPSDTLAAFMAAEGFAGTISLDGDVCTWARQINWHGTPDSVDAGRLWFEAGALIEDGVHANYREKWRAGGDRPHTALGTTLGRQSVFLLHSDARFLLASGVPNAASSRELVAALSEGHRPDGLAAHFANLFVLGHFDGDTGVADLSTHPLLAGRVVLSRAGTSWTLHRPGFTGATETHALDLVPLDYFLPQSAR
jgi:hypothetical protein